MVTGFYHIDHILELTGSGKIVTWWRHQMETFSALLVLCAGNSTVTGEVPTQRPVTRSFDVFFDLRLNERLSKQPRGWWFETPSHPFWRHRNDVKECNMGYLEIVSCQWKTRNWTRMVDDICVVLLIKWFTKIEVHVNKGIMRTLYVWLWFMNRQFCLINLSFKYCKDNAE